MFIEAFPVDDQFRITRWERPSHIIVGSKYGDKMVWSYWLQKESERIPDCEIRYRKRFLASDHSIIYSELALFKIKNVVD